MVRALVFLAVAFAAPRPAVLAQAQSVLHIKIVLVDADRKTTPVPGHALLISDNPATSAPRLVRTGVDGTADVRLRPGNYTIESDRAVTFRGKAYQWTQTLDVPAGRDATLLLTADNAEVTTGATETSPSAPALEADPVFLLPRWQDSVVNLWTPSAHASAFVIDPKGLLATNQKVVGTATSVEVQLTSSVKVSGRVLAVDTGHDVAVLWVDPKAIASIKPVPLGCVQQAPTVAAVKNDGQVFAIGAPFRQPKDMTPGTTSDLVIPDGSDGGPVFTAEGAFVGLTSTADRTENTRRGRTSVRRAADVCEVVAAAERKMADVTPPSGVHLPVEPEWTLPEDAFKDAAQHRAGSLSPYQLPSQSFDVAFITPVMIFGSRYQAEQLARRNQGGRPGRSEPTLTTRLLDFGSWSDYFDDIQPVLIVRVTPKMVENFWTTVARGAALTQGAAIPAIKHAKSGFNRLRAYCGETEVAPIHPFVLEQRNPTGDSITEGLYVFDPGAFGSQCATAKMVLFSEKEPDKAETRVIDPGVIQRISQDFALYH
jgi:S1-C subfamily serine protease